MCSPETASHFKTLINFTPHKPDFFLVNCNQKALQTNGALQPWSSRRGLETWNMIGGLEVIFLSGQKKKRPAYCFNEQAVEEWWILLYCLFPSAHTPISSSILPHWLHFPTFIHLPPPPQAGERSQWETFVCVCTCTCACVISSSSQTENFPYWGQIQTLKASPPPSLTPPQPHG